MEELRCIIIRGDAWLVLLSPCNAVEELTIPHSRNADAVPARTHKEIGTLASGSN